MSLQKAHAVTGAFGFTGSYIAKRLLAQGQRVVTLTSSLQRQSALQGSIEARPYRFDDVQAMAKELHDVEVLYNTYWVRFNHGESTHAAAVRHSLALFEAAQLAGVERIVHISIANASIDSPFEYFSAKAHAENALKASGLCSAIIRPAALFGAGGILINNIAWALRRLPVFACFGSGNYHMQPIYVDDMAALAVEQGALRVNTETYALGPDDFSYRELVRTIGSAIGCQRPVMPLPAVVGYASAWAIGKLMGDVFATKEEIDGLMADLLHVPGAAPTGTTHLADWAMRHRETLGTHYANELLRRKDKHRAY